MCMCDEIPFSTRKYTRKQINSSQQIYVQKLTENPSLSSMQMQIETQKPNKRAWWKKIYNGSN